MSNQHHTWTFPSKGLKAIYDCEIRGQLSDGAWENSTPYNHWQFWNNLETVVGTDWKFDFNPKVDFEHRTPRKRTAYNLTTLVDPGVIDLSGRMRGYYINAEFGLGLIDADVDSLLDRDYEVDTADNVRQKLKELAVSEYWSKRLGRLETAGIQSLVDKMAWGFARYSRNDLIKDLRLIKKQMKAVIEQTWN